MKASLSRSSGSPAARREEPSRARRHGGWLEGRAGGGSRWRWWLAGRAALAVWREDGEALGELCEGERARLVGVEEAEEAPRVAGRRARQVERVHKLFVLESSGAVRVEPVEATQQLDEAVGVQLQQRRERLDLEGLRDLAAALVRHCGQPRVLVAVVRARHAQRRRHRRAHVACEEARVGQLGLGRHGRREELDRQRVCGLEHGVQEDLVPAHGARHV